MHRFLQPADILFNQSLLFRHLCGRVNVRCDMISRNFVGLSKLLKLSKYLLDFIFFYTIRLQYSVTYLVEKHLVKIKG